VLVPGQVITREIVHYLVGLLRSQKRVELHGIVYDGYLPCLRVLKPAEERGLPPHRLRAAGARLSGLATRNLVCYTGSSD